VRTATVVKPGARASIRKPYFKSWRSVCIPCSPNWQHSFFSWHPL
jgi:hypothetical protein